MVFSWLFHASSILFGRCVERVTSVPFMFIPKLMSEGGVTILGPSSYIPSVLRSILPVPSFEVLSLSSCITYIVLFSIVVFGFVKSVWEPLEAFPAVLVFPSGALGLSSHVIYSFLPDTPLITSQEPLITVVCPGLTTNPMTSVKSILSLVWGVLSIVWITSKYFPESMFLKEWLYILIEFSTVPRVLSNSLSLFLTSKALPFHFDSVRLTLTSVTAFVTLATTALKTS